MAARTTPGRVTAVGPAPTRTPTLYCVRHGSTSYNSGDVERFRGWMDVELSDDGVADAGRAGKSLSTIPLSDIYTSDLKRATVTAELIALFNTHGPDIDQQYGLRPWNVGMFSGLPCEANWPKLLRYLDAPSKDVPGGESFTAFADRFFSTLMPILQEAESEESWEPCAIVTHIRNLTLLDAWVQHGASMTRPAYDMAPMKTDTDLVEPGGVRRLVYVAHRWRWADDADR